MPAAVAIGALRGRRVPSAHHHSEFAYTDSASAQVDFSSADLHLHPVPIAVAWHRIDADGMNLHPFLDVVPAPAAQPDSNSGHWRDVLRLLGVDASIPESTARIPMAVRRLEEGSSLAHEGAPLQSLYLVRCGSLKSVRTLEDGYEQVTALALPGDVLGFDGLHCGRHAATDVALEFSTAYAIPLSSLHAMRERCPRLDEAWQLALSRQLARATATADMLAAVASDVRLARFILWLADRAAALGWSSRRLRLTMCRRDLASLLGVAHETVSRSFTMMAESGLLRVHNREIEILDRARLQARARTTRRAADLGAAAVPLGPRDTLPTRPVMAARWPGVLHAGAGH